ncbi:MAG: hypothetical protein Q8P28_09850 [Deltaproteobacteria bacterium]|nr:hypothetical protein [Deltaproteobacteria bacterium]
MNILDEIYKQCHEHLKETDKKRDQILGFFAAVVVIFFSSLDKLGEVKDIFSVILIIFGVLLAIILIHYRKWHTIYVNSAIVLQNLILQGNDVIDKNISEVWETLIIKEDYKRSKKTKCIVFVLKRTLLNTEFTIFNAFLVISFLPLYILISKWTCLSSLSGLIIALFLYILLFNLISWVILRESKKQGYKDSWLLRFSDSKSTSANNGGKD